MSFWVLVERLCQRDFPRQIVTPSCRCVTLRLLPPHPPVRIFGASARSAAGGKAILPIELPLHLWNPTTLHRSAFKKSAKIRQTSSHFSTFILKYSHPHFCCYVFPAWQVDHSDRRRGGESATSRGGLVRVEHCT